MAENKLETFNSELVEKHIVDIIFVVFVCLVGIAGNSVTSIFFWNKTGRSVTDFFLTILSLNDLFTSFVLFDTLFDSVYEVTFTSEVGCKLLASANRCPTTSSFVLIFLIAVDRFLTIFLMNQRMMFSGRSAKMAVVAIYCFTVSTTVPDFVLTEPIKVDITTATNETFAGYYCHRGESNNGDKKQIIKICKLIELGMVVFFLTCMIVIYSIIAFMVAQSKKRVLRAMRQSDFVLIIEKKSKDSSNLNTEIKGTSGEETIDEKDQNTDDVTVDDLSLETISRLHVINKVDTVKSMDILAKTINKTEINTNDITADEMSLNTINKQQVSTKVDTVNSLDKLAKTKREKPKRKISQSTKRDRYPERRITLAMLVMTLASVLTFVPYFIVELAVHEKQYEHSVWMRIMSRSFILNSSINPFIIGYFNPQLRKYFKRIVQRMKVW